MWEQEIILLMKQILPYTQCCSACDMPPGECYGGTCNDPAQMIQLLCHTVSPCILRGEVMAEVLFVHCVDCGGSCTGPCQRCNQASGTCQPANDGTSCGAGQVCSSGQCVPSTKGEAQRLLFAPAEAFTEHAVVCPTKTLWRYSHG